MIEHGSFLSSLSTSDSEKVKNQLLSTVPCSKTQDKLFCRIQSCFLNSSPREDERVEFLNESKIFYTEPEESFDRLTALATRYFHIPIAFISFMDKENHFLKSRMGTSVNSAPKNISFCTLTYVDQHDRILVIEDTHSIPELQDAVPVVNPPYIRFYAGASIFNDKGLKIGCFSLLDSAPHTFSNEQQLILQSMAACVSDLIRYRHEQQRLVERQVVIAQQNSLLELEKPLNEVNRDIAILRNTLAEFSHRAICAATDHSPLITFASDIAHLQTVAAKASESISTLTSVTNNAIDHLQTALIVKSPRN